MKGLTTHVLDTMKGTGAANMCVEVSAPDGCLTTAVLDASGRAVLLEELTAGAYEIRFHAGTEFYDVIPVRFIVEDPTQHYHVPLILSRFGYSTYRGG